MSKDEITLFTKNKLFVQYINLQKEVKQVEEALAEQWKTLQEAMETNDVPKIEGDWGSITLASRKNYKETGKVSDEFKKSVIDTKKVGAHTTLTGEVPEGVEVSETKYLTKRFN